MRVDDATRGRSRIVAALVVAAVSVTGCSSEKAVAPPPATNAQLTALVTQEELNATPPGRPWRSALTWWRLTQFKLVREGLALFTPRARRQLKSAGYETFVPTVFGTWLRTGRPQFQRVNLSDPTHAILYMQTIFNVQTGPSGVRQDIDFLAFAMEKRNGKWLLSDPSWVIAQANNLRDAQAAARRNARGQG